MSKCLYWDNFANAVVTDIEEIAPPERYTQVIEGANETFIEKWSCGNGLYLDIAYTKFERKMGLENRKRHIMAEEHGVKLLYIERWTVPKDHYERIKEAAGK